MLFGHLEDKCNNLWTMDWNKKSNGLRLDKALSMKTYGRVIEHQKNNRGKVLLLLTTS